MRRYVISPDIIYIALFVVFLMFGKHFPEGAAIGLAFTFHLWLVEQNGLIGVKAFRSKQWVLAESCLRASMFFHRFMALLPIKYFSNMLIADLSTLAETLSEQQRYDDALAVNQKTIDVAAKAFGGDSAQLVSELINKSFLLGTRGEAEKAEEVAEKAVLILDAKGKKLSKMEAENLCLALNNLGVMYIDQRKIAKAMDAFERSINLKAEVIGASSESIAVGYGNQGYSLLKVGKYDAAEQFLRRALNLIEGKNVEPVAKATFLNNLGEALRAQNKLEEAENLLTTALTLRQGSLGANHPHFGYSYHNLGSLYADKGDAAKAKSFFQQAIAIRKTYPGPKATELNETIDKYSAYLIKIGEESEAKQLQVMAPSGSTATNTSSADSSGLVKIASTILIIVTIAAPVLLYVSGGAMRLVLRF